MPGPTRKGGKQASGDHSPTAKPQYVIITASAGYVTVKSSWDPRAFTNADAYGADSIDGPWIPLGSIGSGATPYGPVPIGGLPYPFLEVKVTQTSGEVITSAPYTIP